MFYKQEKIKFGWYIVIFFTIAIAIGLPVFAIFDPKDDSGEETLITWVSMGISFALTYAIYNKVEHGKAEVKSVLSYILGILIFMWGMGLTFGLVVAMIAFKEWAITMLVLSGIILAFATILGWLSDTSPREEIRNAKKLSGMF